MTSIVGDVVSHCNSKMDIEVSTSVGEVEAIRATSEKGVISATLGAEEVDERLRD